MSSSLFSSLCYRVLPIALLGLSGCGGMLDSTATTVHGRAGASAASTYGRPEPTVMEYSASVDGLRSYGYVFHEDGDRWSAPPPRIQPNPAAARAAFERYLRVAQTLLRRPTEQIYRAILLTAPELQDRVDLARQTLDGL